jgi:hypothetical protein
MSDLFEVDIDNINNINNITNKQIDKHKLSELSDDIFIPTESDINCPILNTCKYNAHNINIYLIDMSFDKSQTASILINKLKIFYY